jgi:hypothetical protein
LICAKIGSLDDLLLTEQARTVSKENIPIKTTLFVCTCSYYLVIRYNNSESAYIFQAKREGFLIKKPLFYRTQH